MSRTQAATSGVVNAQSVSQTAALTTTSSPTLVSTGVGVTVTSQYTGRYLLLFQGPFSHSSTDAASLYSIQRTAAGGAIPTNGSAITGTTVVEGQVVSASGTVVNTASLIAIDTPGVGTFSYYIAFAAQSAGTVSFSSAALAGTLIAVEI